MKLIAQLLLLVCVFLSSCSKNDDDSGIPIPSNVDYIIFGNVYGACTGDCRDLFLLTADHLYEDSNNSPSTEVTFNDQPLAIEKFDKAKILFNLPETLLTNSVKAEDIIQIIADFDYYINGKVNDVEFKIIYDDIDSTQNLELYQYSQLVNAVINEIK